MLLDAIVPKEVIDLGAHVDRLREAVRSELNAEEVVSYVLHVRARALLEIEKHGDANGANLGESKSIGFAAPNSRDSRPMILGSPGGEWTFTRGLCEKPSGCLIAASRGR
jgi:hypothetical protein